MGTTVGATVGTGVTGGSVFVAAGEGDGLAGASVDGAGVRGAGVDDGEADRLGEVDGDGLADGVATCCDAITAAPSRSNATSATAAKTVKTVDQRSAWRRTGGPPDGGRAGAASAPRGRSSCAVASGSAGGFSCTRHQTARAMPTVGRSTGRPLGVMENVRELATDDGQPDDENDREERHAYQEIDEVLVSLHVRGTHPELDAGLPRTGDPGLDEALRAPFDAELARRTHVAEERG